MIVLTIILCCNIVFGLKSSNQSLYYTVLKKIPSKIVAEAEKELFTRSSELIASESENNRQGASYYKSKHFDNQEQDYKYAKYYPNAGESNHYYKGSKYSYDDDDHDHYHDDSQHDHHHYHHHKKNQKHKYDHHKSYGMKFGGYHLTFFDLTLAGLSALAFGVYLLNGLFNLLTALGLGLFTTTGAGTGTAIGTATGGPTGTATGTATSTGGITVTGPTSTTGTGTGTATGTAVGRAGAVRVKRSPLELNVDPFTSFDTLSHFVLNSIDGITNKHECVRKVFCEGNRQATVIRSGLQWIVPLYSFCASYMGKRLGMHENIPEHVSAILLGMSESNCRSHFPQC